MGRKQRRFIQPPSQRRTPLGTDLPDYELYNQRAEVIAEQFGRAIFLSYKLATLSNIPEPIAVLVPHEGYQGRLRSLALSLGGVEPTDPEDGSIRVMARSDFEKCLVGRQAPDVLEAFSRELDDICATPSGVPMVIVFNDRLYVDHCVHWGDAN